MKNNLYIAAGVICLLTALLHTIGGQLSLVNPLLGTDLALQVKSEWLGAWHLITIILWYFGFILVKNGLDVKIENAALIQVIGISNLLFALVFIIVSLVQQNHTPQYILFLPIAFLTLQGHRKAQKIAVQSAE